MNVIAFEYNSTYFPAAPFVDIEVDGYNEALGKRTLSAMVDSGADATMLPLSVLEAIGATYKESMWLRGATGGRLEVDLYLVAIRIGSNLIRGLHVVGMPNSNETIIGRDVLNQLIVTLNGHASVTEIVVD